MRRGTATLILFLISAGIFGQVKNTLQYEEGTEALKRNDTLKAESYFSESIKLYKDASSYYQLGRIYLFKSGGKFLNKAKKHLKEASRLEPENLLYNLAFAEVLEKDESDEALNEYARLLKDFPGEIEPCIKAGMFCMKKYYLERNISFEADDSEISPYDAAKSLARSKNYFLKALTINKFSGAALKGLAQLFFYAKDYDRSAQYLRRLCKNEPANKDAHLFLGFIYTVKNELIQADQEFRYAFYLMEKEEKEDYNYNSAIMLMQPKYNLNEFFDSGIEREQQIEKFWNIYNPNMNSFLNERLIEHYSRVAYSNLFFSMPDKGIEGWQSERGEAVIRYGLPDSIEVINSSNDYVLTENWIYSKLTLSFCDYDKNGNLLLSGNDDENPYCVRDSYGFFEDYKYLYLQLYRMKGKAPSSLDIKAGFCNFKNLSQNDSYIIDSYFFYDILFPFVNETKDTGYDYRAFLFDHDLDTIMSKEGKIRESIDHNNQLHKSDCLYFQSPYDQGLFALKLKNTLDSTYYAYYKEYNVEGFYESEVSMSGLLLASSIDAGPDAGGVIKRNNMVLKPLLKNIKAQKDSIYLYFEIYDMQKNNKDIAYYNGTVTISKQKEKSSSEGEPSIFEAIGGLFSESRTKYSKTFSGKSKQDYAQEYLKFNVSGYSPGSYEILAQIEDLVGNKKAERKLTFTIY